MWTNGMSPLTDTCTMCFQFASYQQVTQGQAWYLFTIYACFVHSYYLYICIIFAVGLGYPARHMICHNRPLGTRPVVECRLHFCSGEPPGYRVRSLLTAANPRACCTFSVASNGSLSGTVTFYPLEAPIPICMEPTGSPWLHLGSSLLKALEPTIMKPWIHWKVNYLLCYSSYIYIHIL